jgi:hypothetical protein
MGVCFSGAAPSLHAAITAIELAPANHAQKRDSRFT